MEIILSCINIVLGRWLGFINNNLILKLFELCFAYKLAVWALAIHTFKDSDLWIKINVVVWVNSLVNIVINYAWPGIRLPQKLLMSQYYFGHLGINVFIIPIVYTFVFIVFIELSVVSVIIITTSCDRRGLNTSCVPIITSVQYM